MNGRTEQECWDDFWHIVAQIHANNLMRRPREEPREEEEDSSAIRSPDVR